VFIGIGLDGVGCWEKGFGAGFEEGMGLRWGLDLVGIGGKDLDSEMDGIGIGFGGVWSWGRDDIGFGFGWGLYGVQDWG